MMQAVAVKYHHSVPRYIHSLVREVSRCEMGRTHPKWSVNLLNLVIQNGQHLFGYNEGGSKLVILLL